MAGNIKGITIEFKAKYTDLDRAISKINKETSKLDRELKKVDKALKFNPGSVQLWTQKQEILKQKISETEEKLKKLRQQQEILKESGLDETSEEYRKVQREIVECESKLKTFKKQMLEIGNVKLTALSEQLKKVGAQISEVGQTLTRKVTVPLVAGFTAAAKASINFGDAMAKVSTIADESQVPLDTLKKDILDLSNQSGKSATELAEAAYQALSASVSTRDVSKFLTQATGLAKAGFLETAGAVDVLTTVINAYGMSAKDADKIANMLIQTQNDGKTTVNELAESMGNVIPTAAALNVPLEQLSAAYVSLTKQGINTANATTSLNALLNELSKNGSGVANILQQKTGKTFGQLMADGKSLGDILEILNDSVDGDSEAFKNLFGNVRAGKGALALLNGGIDEYNAEVDKMLNATDNVANALDDLKTPGAAARKALTQLVNVGIQLGDTLAPYIQKAAETIQKLVEKFNGLSDKSKDMIVKIGLIVAAIGPVLLVIGKLTSGVGSLIGIVSKIVPLVGMFAGAIGVATPVLIGIAAGIALVIAAGVLLYKHWDDVKKWATQLWDNIKAIFNGIKQTILDTWNNIKIFLTNVWAAIKNIARIAWEGIKAAALGPVYLMATIIRNNWDTIKTVTSNAFNAIKSNVNSVWTSIKNTTASIWNGIKSAIVNPIETAKNTVLGIINTIKSKFPVNIGKAFNIQLPHVSVGSKSVKVGDKTVSVPTFSISWYAKGGIFDNPQLIGVGEKGAEAVVPLDRFWRTLETSNATTEQLLAAQTKILVAMYEEMQKEKNFKVDGIWAGRYVNSLVR